MRTQTPKLIRRIITVVVVLTALIFLTRSPKPDIDARLEAIRATGAPTSAEELNAWYEEPEDPESNAAHYLMMAIQSYQPPPKQANNLPYIGKGLPSPFERLDPKILRDIEIHVEANRETLEALLLAAEKSQSRFPINLSQGGLLTPLPHLNKMKSLAQLSLFRAIQLTYNDEFPQAAKHIHAAYRIAVSLDQEPALISHLISNGVRSVASEYLEWRLNYAPISLEELNPLRSTIQPFETTNRLLNGLIGLRAVGISTFQSAHDEALTAFGLEHVPNLFFKSAIPRNLHDKINKSLLSRGNPRDFAHFIDTMNAYINAASDEFPTALTTAREIDQQSKSRTQSHERSFYYSAHLLSSLRSNYVPPPLRGRPSPFENKAKALALHRVTRVCLEIERYDLLNGHLPPTLDELRSDLPPNAFVDPFSGDSLKYRPEPGAYAIYSVGPNLEDEHRTLPLARILNIDDPGDDISFSIRTFSSPAGSLHQGEGNR